MIVVDGDSVAMVSDTGVPSKHKWPMLLGDQRKMPVESIALAQSTARDCALRVWRVIAKRPKWYVLCIGQWSQNHEELHDFERYVRFAIEECVTHGIQVCLVTPPAEVTDLLPYLKALHKCHTVYRIGMVDLYERLRRERAPAEWFELDVSVHCHFSHAGAMNVVKWFNEPETSHLCQP